MIPRDSEDRNNTQLCKKYDGLLQNEGAGNSLPPERLNNNSLFHRL